jgi:hypothetical protein
MIAVGDQVVVEIRVADRWLELLEGGVLVGQHGRHALVVSVGVAGGAAFWGSRVGDVLVGDLDLLAGGGGFPGLKARSASRPRATTASTGWSARRVSSQWFR